MSGGEATPRPWKLAYDTEIRDQQDDTIVAYEDIEPADAALIVRAVNAHDDLVMALRELVEAFDAPIEDRSVERTMFGYEQARSLLAALAEVRP